MKISDADYREDIRDALAYGFFSCFTGILSWVSLWVFFNGSLYLSIPMLLVSLFFIYLFKTQFAHYKNILFNKKKKVSKYGDKDWVKEEGWKEKDGGSKEHGS